MKRISPLALGLTLALLVPSCSKEDSTSFSSALEQVSHIEGKEKYLASPYVTAGDRLYSVGHQDGSFPDLGWHIKGEMGGVWNHPIKLLDGFAAKISTGDQEYALDKADSFVNYPFANLHRYTLGNGLKVERTQYVPDGKEGMLVQYTVENTGEENAEYLFEFKVDSDLRPTWLGEENGVVNGSDKAEFYADKGYWQIKDKKNPWFVLTGSNLPVIKTDQAPREEGESGVQASLGYKLLIPKGEKKEITIAIAGSYTSSESALETLEDLLARPLELLKEKKSRYATIEANTRLRIPDSSLQQCFEWLKYNSDWLIREVPEVGRGIGAGIPDYPWWFGVDSEYALQGYMAIGQDDIVHQTIALLDSLSEVTNDNGRIIHEVSTNGIVFNPGNINETPQFALLIAEIYRWNGDDDFLKRYYPTVEKGLDWLMSETDQDQNGFPDGFGMMEIHGLDSEMIDVAAYTQKAFEEAAFLSEEMGYTEKSNAYRSKAENLKKQINEKFWSAEFGSYADFIGTDQQTLHLIEDALVRADTLNKPWAMEELEETRKRILANPSSEARPFVLHHNWVVNTPMEMGIADPDKAVQALKTAEKFVNPFGVFVTGIDRDESAGSDDGSFEGSKIFSYTGAVMTLPTGVQAISENNYGRPDQALNYLNRMTRTFSYALPGSMYEVSPDYGMVVQAWNIYSFAVPIVRQFFGIRPMASKKEILFTPQMPSTWEYAQLESVKIADNTIDIDYKKEGKKISLTIEQTNKEFKLILDPTNLLPGKSVQVVRQNGQDLEAPVGKQIVELINGTKMELELEIL